MNFFLLNISKVHVSFFVLLYNFGNGLYNFWIAQLTQTAFAIFSIIPRLSPNLHSASQCCHNSEKRIYFISTLLLLIAGRESCSTTSFSLLSGTIKAGLFTLLLFHSLTCYLNFFRFKSRFVNCFYYFFCRNIFCFYR